MFPGWENIVRKIRTRQPQAEHADIHGPRKTSSAARESALDKHPEAAGTDLDAAVKRAGGEKPAREPPRELLCPVCRIAMKVKNFGPVEVDQCERCGGVFLDRGELKELTGRNFSSFESSRKADAGALIYTPHGLTDHIRDHSQDRPGQP